MEQKPSLPRWILKVYQQQKKKIALVAVYFHWKKMKFFFSDQVISV